MDDGFFRIMSTEEERESFRQWARDNYKAGDEISPLWHPIIKDECKLINNKSGVTKT